MTLFDWKYTLKLLIDCHLINTLISAEKDKSQKTQKTPTHIFMHIGRWILTPSAAYKNSENFLKVQRNVKKFMFEGFAPVKCYVWVKTMTVP